MPADDLESLFYVLIWILVLYDGPLGQERQGFDFESSILGEWSKSTTVNSLLTHTPRFMLQGMGFEDVWGTWEIGSIGPN